MPSVVLLTTLEDISCVTFIEKNQSKASKKINICQEKEDFMALLDSLHVDEPIAKVRHLVVAKIGEVCGTLRNTWQTHFVHTGKEVCHKICVHKVIDILLQRPVLRSKWSMLVEECGCEITKGRSNIFVDQILLLFIKIRSFSYAKDYHSKIKNSAKGNQDERLEERNQKGHESKCAGLIFHHFFHINVSLRI